MKKRILSVLLCATMAVGMLAGCGKEDEATPTPTPTTAPTPTQAAEPTTAPDENKEADEDVKITLNQASAIDITSTLKVYDEGTYLVEEVDGGYKVTATETKGEWSFVYFTIDGDAKAYNAVELVVEGKAGTNYLLKLEGGDAAVVENAYTLSGSEETITWEVSADNFTSVGEQKLIIFLNQGNFGATAGDEEYITIKSVKLITK